MNALSFVFCDKLFSGSDGVGRFLQARVAIPTDGERIVSVASLLQNCLDRLIIACF
jgi:hypothetical protein